MCGHLLKLKAVQPVQRSKLFPAVSSRGTAKPLKLTDIPTGQVTNLTDTWSIMEGWAAQDQVTRFLQYFYGYINISTLYLFYEPSHGSSFCPLTFSHHWWEFLAGKLHLPGDPGPASGGQGPWRLASGLKWAPAGWPGPPRLGSWGCTGATGRCPPGGKDSLWQGFCCCVSPPDSCPSSAGPVAKRYL